MVAEEDITPQPDYVYEINGKLDPKRCEALEEADLDPDRTARLAEIAEAERKPAEPQPPRPKNPANRSSRCGRFRPFRLRSIPHAPVAQLDRALAF